MAVERQGNLETQRVAAAEAAGSHFARTDKDVPYLINIGVRAVELKAVLTRVARAAGDDGLAIDVDFLEGVEGQVLDSQAEQTFHLLFGEGALHSHLAIDVGLVVDDDVVALALLTDPGVVLVDVGSVDYQQIEVALHLIDKQVVHTSSVGIAHDAVENLAVGGVGDVVGEDVVDELLGIGAADEDFAHVADVEDAAGVADSHVFVLDG